MGSLAETFARRFETDYPGDGPETIRAWEHLALNSANASDFTRSDDPFALFEQWLAEARATEINDPEAMTLATVDPDGLPDARMVLCKRADDAGVVFFTNVESAKGRELAATSKAAALFHWKSLRRQVRFRGAVAMLDEAAADAYFRTRPRESRIGAWASQQSRPLESRERLLELVVDYSARFGEGEIPRPPYWRGYRLAPEQIEFWQNGEFRLHDRIAFARADAGWRRERLFP
jgi:pyridoxamine 5'-phosphate oxidase